VAQNLDFFHSVQVAGLEGEGSYLGVIEREGSPTMAIKFFENAKKNNGPLELQCPVWHWAFV
jgi:hypothetical protein